MSHYLRIRTAAALALVAGVYLAAPGCGGKKPESTKAEGKGPEPKADPKVDPKVDPKIEPIKSPQKIDLDSGVGKEAVAFLKALGEGTAKADALSAGFVKMVGLPAELPADKTKGYSADAAASWLKRVGGGGAAFALPSGFAGVNAAVMSGSFQAADRVGGYRLRLVNEAGAWKVDFLALSSVPAAPGTSGTGPDSEYQAFAATAAASLFSDKNAMPRDDRALALAAALTPALRKTWAPPLGSDPDQGFDYNRGALLLKATEIGGGAESFTLSALPATGEFRIEFAKPGGAKTVWLFKLVKGAAPGQWLVDSVTPQ